MFVKKQKVAFLKRVFGGATVNSDGINIAVMCPNKKCNSRKKGKRKLSIRIDTDQSHCWVCGLKTGNTLIPVLRKVCTSAEVSEYVKKFAVKKSEINTDIDVDEDDSVTLPSDYQLLGMLTNSRVPSIKRAIKYLKDRGLTERDFWRFKLGISDDPMFEERIIIPSFDEEGFLNTYAARTYNKRGFPNYMIPDVKRVGIIFNEVSIDWSKELTLVEGPFDLMKCTKNATCLQGSTLNEDYLLFWKIVTNKTPVVLSLDADAVKKSIRIAKLLYSYNVPVKIMELDGFADVGEMSHNDFENAYKKAKVWDSMSELRMSVMSWTPTSNFETRANH